MSNDRVVAASAMASSQSRRGVLPDTPRLPVTARLAIAIGAGLVVTSFLVYAQLTASHILGDAYYYLAAGERLNAGHPLYALSPGDRLVAIQAPFWTVPWVSPPFLAVVWRPLAALPSDLGPAIWWLGSLLAIATSLIFLVGRNPTIGGLAMAVLCVPIAMELGLANVNGFLLAGAVVAWRFRDRWWVGVVLGLMIAVKIWPAVLAVWLLTTTKRRDTFVTMVATVAFAGLIGLVGAGWDNNIAYLTVGRSVHPSAFSLTWLLGLPWLWPLSLVLGLVGIVLLRDRPEWSFRIAILTMVLGNPVANPNTYAQLIALVIRGRGQRGQGQRGD